VAGAGSRSARAGGRAATSARSPVTRRPGPGCGQSVQLPLDAAGSRRAGVPRRLPRAARSRPRAPGRAGAGRGLHERPDAPRAPGCGTLDDATPAPPRARTTPELAALLAELAVTAAGSPPSPAALEADAIQLDLLRLERRIVRGPRRGRRRGRAARRTPRGAAPPLRRGARPRDGPEPARRSVARTKRFTASGAVAANRRRARRLSANRVAHFSSRVRRPAPWAAGRATRTIDAGADRAASKPKERHVFRQRVRHPTGHRGR
jgi:hypothetical protein